MTKDAEVLYTNEYKTAENNVKKLEEKYKPFLEVNYDLDRKIVSFQANKIEPIFRWFHYREGFSKQLIEYILDACNIKKVSVKQCSCGNAGKHV